MLEFSRIATVAAAERPRDRAALFACLAFGQTVTQQFAGVASLYTYFGATVVILILVSLMPPNRSDRWLGGVDRHKTGLGAAGTRSSVRSRRAHGSSRPDSGRCSSGSSAGKPASSSTASRPTPSSSASRASSGSARRPRSGCIGNYDGSIRNLEFLRFFPTLRARRSRGLRAGGHRRPALPAGRSEQPLDRPDETAVLAPSARALPATRRRWGCEKQHEGHRRRSAPSSASRT